MSAVQDPVQHATALLQQGKIREAKTLLLETARSENNADAFYLLAKIAVREKEFVTAQGHMRRVLEIDPDRSICHFDLGGIELEQGRFEAALPHFEKAAALLPGNPFVLLHLAMVMENVGRKYDAAVVYKRCWAVALKEGEKLGQLPPPLQGLMMHGRKQIASEIERMLDEVMSEVRAAYGNKGLERVERLIAVINGKAPQEKMPLLQRPGGLFFPGLPERKFFERELFPWFEEMEARTAEIRDEYLAVATDQEAFKPYVDVDENSRGAEHWAGVNKSRAWSSCHIYRNGKLRENVAAKCPVTVEALNKAPLNRVVDHGPEAMFSVLHAGTHIPPHHGTINGRVIVHLPLIVPENCGALRVAGETRAWEYGRCFAFDDSYAHEAWNHSTETRVVLLFDVWSPFLTEIEIAAFARVIEVVDRINIAAIGEGFLRE